jgi:hypothetical protein
MRVKPFIPANGKYAGILYNTPHFSSYPLVKVQFHKIKPVSKKTKYALFTDTVADS